MPIKITIPTPCHEKWDAMTPNNIGRHCDVCSKTVIDFTTWQPQQILLHFETNTNVCGRFKAEQLNEPLPTVEDFVKQIAYFSIPFLKKIAAIFLFVFIILGSNNKAIAQGAPMANKEDTVKQKKAIPKDYIKQSAKLYTNNDSYGNVVAQFVPTTNAKVLQIKKRKLPKRRHWSSKYNISRS